jgi:hypothetical protein
MPLRECINNHPLAASTRSHYEKERGVEVPPSAVKNIETSSSGYGRKIPTDLNRPLFSSPGAAAAVQAGTPQTSVSSIKARALHYRQVAFNRLKNEQLGRNHLSVPVIVSNSGRDCNLRLLSQLANH